ncbi:hypothetical protein COPCOM_03783 [Coprococcus comes ATCC 27758]|uniref:Uncharacterized protein n=1 Tax=Coprococcus comes ATCC 27758 TaxID=470146 RepID=C0BF21_9FIRM|nr:hypothetical protein COPCOM_03783 [Coprococcus comes ATCC 27758]
MQAWPPDSLLRENESSVRDLPLVKQNFFYNKFIECYLRLQSLENSVFSGFFCLSLFIIVYAVLDKFWTKKKRGEPL